MNSNIKDVYGLTPAQEGIYVQYFQSDDPKTYHFHTLCKINKETNTDMIKKSAELLFLRHQALKTAFTVLKSTGAIKQVILENRQPEFVVLAPDEPFSQKVLDNIISEDTEKPLDLQRDSLIKITVIDFTDERFLLFRSHHIILDGWCFPIIINDLQRYYAELSSGVNTEKLSDEIKKEVAAETSYAQYVNWLKKQDKTEAAEYWQSLLRDCTYPHIFGKENKDNKKNRDIVTFRTYLNEEVSQSIESFAQENRVSNNTVFESAFSVALQKFSGSDDIVFDKVISGRSIPLKNIENTIGLFVNTVPVRIKSDENSTLSDLLKETQKQTVNANKCGVLALSEIYKTCDINSRLIDALFVFENYYIGDLNADIEKGLLSPEFIFFNEQTEFNLSVAVFKENGRYFIRSSYARDLYTEKEINRFVEGYIYILKSYLDGEKQIKDISLTDKDLIEKVNSTEHSYVIPESTTLYSMFENTAKKNKEKVCIKTAEKKLTFGELLNISENLDIEIREITRENKSVVAVIAERSAEMYGAIYGIIRGGNAYLPIDPDYPQERIDYILENSGAAAVVAQGKFVGKVKNIPCIDMTELLKVSADKQANAPIPCAEPDDTAYVIYTSGSTGNPKGAKISHKSAINRILWMHDKYPLGAEDVILQKTPYTFDVSVWELFWWGLCAGSLAVSKPGEHFLPAKILEEVQKNRVTHLHFVPSVFELLLNYLETHKNEIQKFNSVKHVFLSGEALTANLVHRFYTMYDYDKVTLHNLYGPTECAVDVTYYDCIPTDTDPVPIGKPIYNTQMYVVDKYNNVVPVGVTGELCIAGVNVGQGYLNNPELTAEKFIDNPFGEGKLYKTGDLAYLKEDGNIVFVGRKDSQVKLSGQRIETGEIEAVISAVSGVETAAVIVRKVNAKDVLVAFYSGKKEREIEIKNYCRKKLPRYMVPSFVVKVDEMPLNQSGKLDRKALANAEIVYESETEAPANGTERHICEVFENILGVKNVGRNSDFFEMGGTSLSMISLLAEAGFENVTVADFMRNSTPAMLSSVIKAKKQTKTEYLEPLHISDKANQVMILLPFAGGGAEAYSNFVKALKNADSSISVYYIRYLHSVYECKQAADEIAAVLTDKEVMFYSHCVGSAVALHIIHSLEKKNFCVKHYFAGAGLPPVKVTKSNIWNLVPDIVLKHILLKAGADFRGLSRRKISNLLRNFRKDTDFAKIGFYELREKLNTPVSVVITKTDMFTKNYEQADKLWIKYFKSVSSVHFIDSESHYFQKDNAEKLIGIILKNI